MKIKTKEITYEEFEKLPSEKAPQPIKPSILFRTLLKVASSSELKATNFKVKKIDMDKLKAKEPALILMNHSCFLDLKIAATILYPRPFNIVCTQDGFVGQNWLLRHLGCIPAKKFVTDYQLFPNMKLAIQKGSSVLMYPEASYSFDGTATNLPSSLGKCLKLLDVPVIMIKTFGAFQHDPLYNGLQLRKVNVSAEMKYLLSKEDVEEKSVEELNEILNDVFTFDNFKWQIDNHIKVNEPFRADYLNRVLYKCPHCLAEDKMEGKGIKLTCHNCGAEWELSEYGELVSLNRDKTFSHIPDWFRWEREEVRKEIEIGTYKIDVDVQIYGLKDTKCLYKLGEGHLHHDNHGFVLDGCDGKLQFKTAPLSQYSLYSDYYWYEIGDMISIGNNDVTYYCFPKNKVDLAAKARLATEEIFNKNIK